MRGVASRDYAKMSIFAHEVGHHVNGHTLGDYNLSLSESRLQELEADEWSGRVMFLMGYSLEQAQEAMHELHDGDNYDDRFSTHPSLNKRLHAIETGWRNAEKQMRNLSGSLNTKKGGDDDQYIPQSMRNNTGNLKLNYYELGDEMFNEGKYNLAINNFTKAIDGDFEPKEYAYVYRGVCYSRMENYYKAKLDYSSAIRINSKYGLAYYNRAISRTNLNEDNESVCSDFRLACNYDYEQACEYSKECETSSKTSSTNYTAEEYFYMGYDVHSEDPRLAIEYYTKAIDGNFENKKYAYFNRALCQAEFENYTAAISDYNSAIRLDSKWGSAYYNRAIDKKTIGDESYCNDLKLGCDYNHENACEYFIEENCNRSSNNNRTNNSDESGCKYGDCDNGYGSYAWADGEQYVGEWKNSYRHGRGTYTWTDGNQYVGEYKNDKRHGKGTFTYANGDQYTGDWKDGNKEGKGTYVWEKSGNMYQGEWINDAKSGKGTFTWANGDQYFGEYMNDKEDGYGTMSWVDGDKYVGDWKNGQRHGFGTYTFPNGEQKKGRWENNTFID